MGALPAQDRLLRPPVVFQTAVPVEMVGGEVGDDGNFRARRQAVEILKLKAAQFQHRPVVGTDVLNLGQQTAADVSPQMRRPSGGLEHGMDQAGRRRFSVAARHADHRPAAELPEEVHLAGERNAGSPGELQQGMVAADGRVDHHQIRRQKILFAVSAKMQRLEAADVDLLQRVLQFVLGEKIGDRHRRAACCRNRTAPTPPPDRPSPITVTRQWEKSGRKCAAASVMEKTRRDRRGRITSI